MTHGVPLDNPGLADAVMHVVNGNDGAAVEDIARRYGLSAVEAEQVLHALVGDGPRPAGCFLDEQGRLKLMAPGTDILDEIQEVTPSLLGATLTMPSRTCPGGVRWVGLDEIDGVFHALDEERRQTGEDLESYEDTLSWMRAEIGRLDAFESAFLAVNELAPPSDWLRDLKAALGDTDALYALRGRAEQERATQDQASGKQAVLPFTALTESFKALADTFTIPAGSLRKGTVITCSAEATLGFTPPTAPAQPSVAYFDGDDITTDTPAPERLLGWMPEGWRVHKVTNHFYGPNGEQVFNHGHGHVVAWGSTHEGVEAWTEWTERDKRALVLALAHPERALVQDATEDHAALRTRAESFLLSDDATDLTSYDLGAHEAALAILRGDGSGPDPRVTMRGEIEQGRVAVAGLMELLGQRVVADGERSIAQVSACAYLSQAIEGNPGALNFLEDGWTWIDDSGTPRSYVATVQRIEGQTPGQMIAELKAQNARLKAILDAETGRKGLDGWTWDGECRRWQLPSAAGIIAIAECGDEGWWCLGPDGMLSEAGTSTDALDGMERATARLKALSGGE